MSNEMQGVTLINKSQEKHQPNQKLRGTSPNVIGNVEDLAPFNFGLRNIKNQPAVVAEESKSIHHPNN